MIYANHLESLYILGIDYSERVCYIVYMMNDRWSFTIMERKEGKDHGIDKRANGESGAGV